MALGGELVARGRRSEHERAREQVGWSGEERSAVGRCRRARGSGRRPAATRGGVDGAWPPRGGRVLPWSGRGAGERRGAARSAGQTRAGLGWAEARRAALREARWAGFGRGPRSEAAAHEIRKAFFKLCFQEIFKHQFSNIILSKKMTSSENVPKMKVD